MISQSSQCLLAELEQGLPLVHQPFKELGERVGLSQQAVLTELAQLQSEGIIRRMGAIVRHRALGMTSNAMVAWDIPNKDVSPAGEKLGQLPFVNLCYQRRRHPNWTYNLYCMIHGNSRPQVERQIEEATVYADLAGYPRKALFSKVCYKQRGAHYFSEQLNELDKNILNRLQDGIEVNERPFNKMAQELEISEDLLLARLQRMRADGRLSRFGPMYNVEKFGGVFTLVAMAVPRERFAEVTNLVNSYVEVAHNYEREHSYNMWFVLATASQAETENVLADLASRTGLHPLALPKLEEYYLNLRLKV